MQDTNALPVTPEDIESAYARIRPHIRRTPVMESDGDAFGHDAPVNLKLELFQHAGSFKPRGAFNNLLVREVPPAGVAAASGGNHGAAVAYAAHRLGHAANIFVPEISSPAKIGKIRRAGATLHIDGARYADALANCERFQADSGAIGIHAYAEPLTVAGQGTLALEWEEQAPGLDTVLIAVGGGGLISGAAAYFRGRVKLVGVEPRGSRALHAALEAGHPVDVEVDSLAADSLGARSVGEINHAICARHVDHVALVDDDAIRNGMEVLWNDFQIAAEPGGATALAALLSGAYRPAPGERLGILVCGGNVDPAMLPSAGS
jgi:threonine dehydratase